MSTVLFVYTEGVQFKATNVTTITHDESVVEYTQSVINESGTIGGINLRVVDKSDLLYAVVKNTDTGELTIIPGLYDSFDIVPKGNAVTRQKNIEAEAERVAKERAAKAPQREADEKAKYEARRAKRKAEYLATNPQDEAANTSAQEVTPNATTREAIEELETPQPTAPTPEVAEVAEAPKPKSTRNVSVEAQLSAAGLSAEDMAVLRSLGVLR